MANNQRKKIRECTGKLCCIPDRHAGEQLANDPQMVSGCNGYAEDDKGAV